MHVCRLLYTERARGATDGSSGEANERQTGSLGMCKAAQQSTGVRFMVRSGFREYEVKKLRSPACSRQENAMFPPHIHGTWGSPFRPSLYYVEI